MAGPLGGATVIELAGLGPGPSPPCCWPTSAPMSSGSTGRARWIPDARAYAMHRGRRSVAVDLKHPDGREVVLRLVERADALIEGHRPG